MKNCRHPTLYFKDGGATVCCMDCTLSWRLGEGQTSSAAHLGRDDFRHKPSEFAKVSYFYKKK